MIELKNGRIFIDDKLIEGSIFIKEGKIAKIQKFHKDATDSQITDSSQKNQILDCTGCIILPGFIDTHVHFRDLEQSLKETITSGSLGAIHAGVTTVLTMPNTDPPLSSLEILQKYREICQSTPLYCNIGFNIGIKTGFTIKDLPKIKSLGVFGIKVYPGDTSEEIPLQWNEGWKCDFDLEEFHKSWRNITENFKSKNPDNGWQLLFDLAKKESLPIIFHPELPRSSDKLDQLFSSGLTIAHTQNHPHPNLYAHDVAHPIYTNELAHIEMITCLLHQIYPSPQLAPHVHFAHVSCAEGIKIIQQFLKAHGYNASSEITPHHLLLSHEKCNTQDSWAKVLVPLRSLQQQRDLYNMVSNEQHDTFGTDHAPHTLKEKSEGFLAAPSGFPSIDFASRIFLTEVFAKHISLAQFIRSYVTRPAEIFHIPNKGKIEEGFDADLTIVRQVPPYQLRAELSQSQQKWSPWEGTTLTAEITHVMLNGEIVVDHLNNRVSARGQIIIPSDQLF